MICTSLLIGIHLGTYHFNRNVDYQEINPGVYISCPESSIVGGFYRNSENHISVYAGRTFSFPNLWNTQIILGVVTGYERANLAPLVLVSKKLGDNFRVSLIPPVDKKTGGIHLSFEF